MGYIPENHYWSVKGHSPASEVFSSLTRTYVSDTNSAYLAWLQDEEDNFTTVISSEDELFEVLKFQAPEKVPSTDNRFKEYLQEEIRNEADRRIAKAINARSFEHAQQLINNICLISIAFINKKADGSDLTLSEQETEQEYSTFLTYVRAVKLSQETLEKNLTTTFADNSNWPADVSITV